MVIETEVLPFLAWLPQGLWEWVRVVASLSVATLVIVFLVLAVRHGPRAALRRSGRGLIGVVIVEVGDTHGIMILITQQLNGEP